MGLIEGGQGAGVALDDPQDDVRVAVEDRRGDLADVEVEEGLFEGLGEATGLEGAEVPAAGLGLAVIGVGGDQLGKIGPGAGLGGDLVGELVALGLGLGRGVGGDDQHQPLGPEAQALALVAAELLVAGADVVAGDAHAGHDAQREHALLEDLAGHLGAQLGLGEPGGLGRLEQLVRREALHGGEVAHAVVDLLAGDTLLSPVGGDLDQLLVDHLLEQLFVHLALDGRALGARGDALVDLHQQGASAAAQLGQQDGVAADDGDHALDDTGHGGRGGDDGGQADQREGEGQPGGPGEAKKHAGALSTASGRGATERPQRPGAGRSRGRPGPLSRVFRGRRCRRRPP